MSKYIHGIHEERFDNFLKDLRSGEYKQGTHTLEDPQEGKFCCLGVACVRPAAEGVISRKVADHGYSVTYDQTSGALPIEVADWLGIPVSARTGVNGFDTDIRFEKQKNIVTAIQMNDIMQKSFNEIADVFEKEFLKED